jgi:hypothetical protein
LISPGFVGNVDVVSKTFTVLVKVFFVFIGPLPCLARVFFYFTGRTQTDRNFHKETIEKGLDQVKKKKVTFEELLKANRRELLEDEKQLEKIEERIEERQMGQKKLLVKGEI